MMTYHIGSWEASSTTFLSRRSLRELARPSLMVGAWEVLQHSSPPLHLACLIRLTQQASAAALAEAVALALRILAQPLPSSIQGLTRLKHSTPTRSGLSAELTRVLCWQETSDAAHRAAISSERE